MLMWNGTPVHSPTPDQRSKIEDNDLKKKIKTTRFRTLTLTIAFASATVWGQTAMPKKIHQEAFSIVGIEARTSNAQEMKGEGCDSQAMAEVLSGWRTTKDRKPN